MRLVLRGGDKRLDEQLEDDDQVDDDDPTLAAYRAAMSSNLSCPRSSNQPERWLRVGRGYTA